MRKITSKAAAAFRERRPFKRDNTEVTVDSYGEVRLYLHGNLIAMTVPGGVVVGDAGWRTVTTKDRLNAVLPHGWRIYQRRFDWFLGRTTGGATEELEWLGGAVFSHDGELQGSWKRVGERV